VVKIENGVINSGEVTGATGLVLFGFEGERVNVGDGFDVTVSLVLSTTVVLVSLDFSEVFAFSAFEAVVTVKLKESIFGGDVSNSGVNSPYKFFYRVVEAKFMLGAFSADGKSVGVLNLFDEVFV
tara:strand:- start:169 stop:543 length:375 start_codon:yes stop_codon:yes gene_type:complete